MKTIDLLVKELPKIGGWPEKVTHIGQDYDCELMFYGRGHIRTGIILDELAIDHRKCGEVGVKITREQYEAALAAKNDGWIEWGGGECPVPYGTMVDVKYRDGLIKKGLQALIVNSGRSASRLFWAKDNIPTDIIAYRLHQPQETEQAEADDEAYLDECIGQDATPVWGGEGLPPVGCECEFMKHMLDAIPNWRRGIIKYVSEYTVVIVEALSHGEFVAHPRTCDFRPIRSEADKKREDALDAIYGAIASAERAHNRSDEADKVYEAIAAGKIPGVKLED